MEYKTNKEIDKSTIIWLDNFEEKLCNDLKRLLKKDVYKSLGVSYTLNLEDGLHNGYVYEVEGNASISLSKSYEFQSEVISWFNTHLSELRMVLSSNFHLKMTLIYSNYSVFFPAQLRRMYDILKLKSFKVVRDRNQVLLYSAEMLQAYMAGGSTYAVLWKHFPQPPCFTN